MTNTNHAEILTVLAKNAIDRLESSKRILSSMPGTIDSSYMEAFYDGKIESIQKFLKALSFTKEVDVELCEILDFADYSVTADALNNESSEFSAAINQLHLFTISTPVNPENTAEDKVKVYFDQQWAIIEAKSAFFEMYNKVRFS